MDLMSSLFHAGAHIADKREKVPSAAMAHGFVMGRTLAVPAGHRKPIGVLGLMIACDLFTEGSRNGATRP